MASEPSGHSVVLKTNVNNAPQRIKQNTHFPTSCSVQQLTTMKIDILIEKLILQKCPWGEKYNKSRMISVQGTVKCPGDSNKKHQGSFPGVSSVQFSCSVMSDSLRPHKSQHARPPCPSPLPEFTQTHVHRVSDAIQPSHPLSSPSPPAPNPSQHQSLFP